MLEMRMGAGMSELGDFSEERSPRQRYRPGGRGWIRIGLGLTFFAGCLLCLALIVPRHPPPRRRAAVPPVTVPPPQTPFLTAFTRAQRWYLSAQITTKRQLESLEEWDPDGIRGSMPEIYHRSLIAHTQELGKAEAAAREAADRAVTDEEKYRATRLLMHIAHDMSHHRKELTLAKKLVELEPRQPEARLLLERVAAENVQRH
jgi:hypothetical protein